MKKLLLILLCVPLITISQDYKTLEVIDAEYNTSMGTNFPDFSPIGWSKNGEFAYQIIIHQGGIGLVENSIYVISTKTDQVLDSINLIDWENWDGSINPHTKGKEINRILSKYNIDDNKEIEFYSKNTIEDFSIFLDEKYTTTQDYCGCSECSDVEYKIIVDNKILGDKMVTYGSEHCLNVGLGIEGYIISPFEERILIILSGSHNGFESEEDYFINFFGCSLDPSTFK